MKSLRMKSTTSLPNVIQVPINLSGLVSPTIVCGVRKAGIANILPLNPTNQHYVAFLVVYEADTDKPR